MMTVSIRHLHLFIGAAVLLAGCASPRETATFITKTSLSVVDIDSVPASASIAYDRIEGYVGPRFQDGSVFPVASSVESKGTGINREIRQVYAAGNAARIVTGDPSVQQVGGAPAAIVSSGEDSNNKKNRVMFFGTATTVGLKIGFAEGSVVPNAFTLGYKRKEASIIPLEPGLEPSVLGAFSNGAGAESAPDGGTPSAKFGFEQYFATGRAADALAQKGTIKARFQDGASQAMGDVAKYRLEEARQGRVALDIVHCFASVPDDKLNEVWISARHMGIFRDLGTTDRIERAVGVQRRREIYLGELGIALDPDSTEYTTALKFHQKVVCTLKKSAG